MEITNSILRAQRITGIQEPEAAIGGFRLCDATSERIERTLGELQAVGWSLMMPVHCLAFVVTCLFAEELAEELVVGVVDTQLDS